MKELKDMVEKILFGSYCIQLSKSNLADIIRNDLCYILDNNVLNATYLNKI